ncbi:VPLPA-CTERM sorting domain-containing protein [Kordiimonas sp.]|uniref:VPLPA-CTERM sorting domain-containing protein n=1 Tax=Kordiimonas sp. TaxID=1970157 RepID=UPI003A8D4E38
MRVMDNVLSKAGAGALAVTAALTFTPMAAEAATIYATSAEIVVDGPRGTANDRDNINNAFGSADGSFFELGYDAVVEFQFGTPTGQSFFGPGSLIEITFNNDPNWKEAVKIEVGMKGDAGSFVTADPLPFVNTNTFANPVFTFSGIFDTVRLTDMTLVLFGQNTNDPSDSTRSLTGGFDLDAIAVSAVPLPAAGFLLIGALGGLAALRRRRKAA